MSDTVVVHLSDLHFGRRFQLGKWESLTKVVKAAKPDLVVVTGDVVNSPWRSRLRNAESQLTNLRNELRRNAGKGDLELLVVPGNHDTRFFGLISLHVLLGLALFFLIFSAVLALCGHPVLALAPLTIGIFGLILRLLMTTNLKKYLGEMLLLDSKIFHGLGVGVIGFDSASKGGIFGAHGRLPAGSITSRLDDAMGARSGEGINGSQCSNIFWMAAVHHHALPIPYDSKFESVMIMENAGTLLQELLKKKVPLILHGHKHHQHFSRLRARLNDGSDREISVLSAGTPTEGNDANARHHSFNILRISGRQRVNIAVYEAPSEDGGFEQSDSIELTSEGEYAKRSFSRVKDVKDIYCARMFHSAVIDESGDARLAREFTAVGTKVLLKEFPYNFPAQCRQGEIHSATARILTHNGPTATPDFCWQNTGDASCRVSFGGRGFNKGDDLIDFFMSYRADNAFALDSVQYEQMYPNGRSEKVEYMIYSVPDCLAVEEFHIELRFPSGVSIPPSMALQVANHRDAPDSEWSELPRSTFARIHCGSMVFARIEAPEPNSAYRFVWEVESKSIPADKIHQQYEKALRDIPKLLLSARSTVIAAAIQEFLSAVRELASRELTPDPARAGELYEHLGVVLFAYDENGGRLFSIGALGRDEQGVEAERGYGLGLPGRAYKTGQVAVYDPTSPEAIARQTRQQADISGTSTEVQRPNASRTLGELAVGSSNRQQPLETDCAQVALPMYPETESLSQRPYAVVLLSVDGFSGPVRLFDTYSDRSQSKLRGAAQRLLAKLVTDTILAKKGGVV